MQSILNTGSVISLLLYPMCGATGFGLTRKPWIVPIPGTTRIHRLEENIGSVSVALTAGDLGEINAAASKIPIQGERLPESILRMSYR